MQREGLVFFVRVNQSQTLSKGESYEQLDSTMQGERCSVIIERRRRRVEETRVVRRCKKETHRPRRTQGGTKGIEGDKIRKRINPLHYYCLDPNVCAKEDRVFLYFLPFSLNLLSLFLTNLPITFTHPYHHIHTPVFALSSLQSPAPLTLLMNILCMAITTLATTAIVDSKSPRTMPLALPPLPLMP